MQRFTHNKVNKNKQLQAVAAPALLAVFGFLVFISPSFVFAQSYDDAGSGCCDIVNTYTPSNFETVNTYTPPSYETINTYTPASSETVNTYTPPSWETINTYTPPNSETINTYTPPSSVAGTNNFYSGGGSSGGGFVSGGSSSGSSIGYLTGSGYSSGGGYVTGGIGSVNPVSFYYPSPASPTHWVSGGMGASAPVTFNYPAPMEMTHYVTGGISGGNNGAYYSGYAAPTCWLSISPQYISAGQSATISWSSNNASSGYIPGVGTVVSNGQSVVAPSQTTQYNATFTGPAGSTNCYGTVVVNGGSISTPAAASVTLSQVPYTGLDLGPVGTILYWLGLVLVCALFSYLVAVRRIQNDFLKWLRVTLLGDPEVATHPAYVTVEVERVEEEVFAPAVTTRARMQESDYVDPFLLRQIFPA